jgi:hypothetical protein
MELFVKTNLYRERLAKCQACKFYMPDTKSCGPLIVGDEVETEVLFRKKSITLCGCVMPIKAKLAYAKCPANRWGAVISPEQIEELKAFVQKFSNAATMDSEGIKELKKFKELVYGQQFSTTTCGPCIKRDLRNLSEIISHF